MKAKIFLFVAWLIITGNLSAQNPGQAYTNKMDSVFQLADKSRIATGLLSDYGLQMVEPAYFNGVPADSNYVDMDTWKMLYTGMYSSKINNNASLTSPETVFSQVDNATHTTAVPVAMMHYQYNQLNENAVNLGLLQVVNDQIIDVPGAALPYLTKQLFAVAPKELSFDGPTIRFVFKSNLFYKNVNKTIQKREINFNNESGYLTAGWDAAVSYTFGSGGVKTIYFRLTYTDGTSYTSYTNISVTISTPSLRSATGDADIPISETTQHSGGTMQIRLSNYNSSGVIKKPLIVAEGFDASGVISSMSNQTVDQFLNRPNTTTSFGTINVPYPGTTTTLYGRIDLSQFDIIYLDYKDGVDNIFRNAQLFKSVIQYVNANKVGNEPNVVMGISMGGLVARIALRQMEVAGQNHQTSKYISVDSPHKGANVPIGLQAAVRHIQNINLQVFFINVLDYNNFKEVKGAVDLLNSMAAKQMLIYTVNSSYSFDNSVHNTFQQAYDQLGFPQQCQNIAIANGSNNGSLNFAPGSAIIDYKESYSFKWWMDALAKLYSYVFIVTNYPQLVLNMIPGNSQVNVELNVNALSNQSNSRIYKGRIYVRKKILWLIPVNINLTETTINGSGLPIDGAPGGLYSMSMMGDSLPIPASAVKQSQFCFVPTVSSLALNDWNTRLTQNLTNVTTPFDHRFTQATNELHTRFNTSASFLYNQLTTPVNPPVLPPTITGPSTFHSTGTFTINNLPAGAAVSVQTSSPALTATVSGNTIILTMEPYNGSYFTNYGENWLQVTLTVGTQTILLDHKRFICGEFFGAQEVTPYRFRPQHYGGVVEETNWCSVSNNSINKFWIALMDATYAPYMQYIRYQVRLVRASNQSVVYTMNYTVRGNDIPLYDVHNETPLYEEFDNHFQIEYNGISGAWYNIEMRIVSYNKDTQWEHNLNGTWHYIGSVLYGNCPSNYNPHIAECIIYPNPNNGIFTLKRMQPADAAATPLNQSATPVQKKSQEQLTVRIYASSTVALAKEMQIVLSDETTINTGGLPKGKYIVQVVRDNTVIHSSQMIIE